MSLYTKILEKLNEFKKGSEEDLGEYRDMFTGEVLKRKAPDKVKKPYLSRSVRVSHEFRQDTPIKKPSTFSESSGNLEAARAETIAREAYSRLEKQFTSLREVDGDQYPDSQPMINVRSLVNGYGILLEVKWDFDELSSIVVHLFGLKDIKGIIHWVKVSTVPGKFEEFSETNISAIFDTVLKRVIRLATRSNIFKKNYLPLESFEEASKWLDNEKDLWVDFSKIPLH